MKRAPFDIDNKVLAGVLVGLITYVATKLAIPLDAPVEQALNVGAALLAAYLVPSSTPAELAGEGAEGDDVTDPPSSAEIAAVHQELSQPIPAPEPAYAYAGPVAVPAYAGADVDEDAVYGEVNRTGLTYGDVERELSSGPLDEMYGDGPPTGFDDDRRT